MNVAFRARCGPLEQVGLQIIGLDQAIQLATGAYGWYKAKERTQSLTQLLSTKGASLVSTSSFDKRVYVEYRSQRGQLLGVVIQNSSVASTTLPIASTAIPDDPGHACLRALTTGLLCFFKTDATVSILAELIPHALLQLEQEDTTINIEGPLLTGLRQYVIAIAAEEDSNTVRTELLQLATGYQERLSSFTLRESLEWDSVDKCEAVCIIGFLKWMLTPWHKREPLQYPTRSLRTWSLAPIMHRLGFQLSTSTEVIRTSAQYTKMMDPKQFLPEWPEVVLVTTNAGPTDLCESYIIISDDEPKPEIVVMRAIPWLAFRHLRRSKHSVDIQYLTDIWMYSYRQCREGLTISWTDPIGHIRLVANPDRAVVLEHHKALLRIFSPHLDVVCGPAMRSFVPGRSEGEEWLPHRLERQMQILRTGEDAFQHSQNLRDNCYILIAIVLGTLYGIVSKFCRENGQELGLDSEIVFAPEMLYKHRIKTWASFLSLPLNSPPSFKDWNLMLLEVVLGHRAKDLNGYFSDGDHAAAQSGENGTTSSTQLPIGLVLGAQASGMTAVLDFIVHPSLRPGAISTLHIARGQMLSLPVGQHGYIETSQRQELGMTMNLNPCPNTRILKIKPHSQPDTSVRIDAEPCWERQSPDGRTQMSPGRDFALPIEYRNDY